MLLTLSKEDRLYSRDLSQALRYNYMILSLLPHILFITSKGFRASFQKEFIIQKVGLEREPTQAS